MKKTRYSDAQIMGILKQAESGVPVSELCREHGMSNASFYKWRAKFGGMDASMIEELKAMAEKNRHLKRMYALMSMQNDLLKEALGKSVRPSLRKEMAVKAVANRGVSVALACRAFQISECCYRYERKQSDENAEIAEWLVKLTSNRRTWGFGLCYLYLRNVKGFVWNHKRVYRIYCELELNLRIRPKKRLKRDKPDTLAVPDVANHTWSIAARQAMRSIAERELYGRSVGRWSPDSYPERAG